MNITLIGKEGTGKTTIGRNLAERLKRKFISISNEVNSRLKMAPEKYIKKHGVDKFLEAESEAIEHICAFEDYVFDANETIIMRNENINNLKTNGLVILLTADEKTIKKRMKKTKKESKKLLKLDQSIMDARLKTAADYAINTSSMSPEEVCDIINYYLESELM